MSALPYPPPVNKLLTFDPCDHPREEWPNYLVLGFGPEHIPDLIRMALDPELNQAETESLEVWAPVHAWRTLGQLRAEAAIEPLLTLLSRIDDAQDDWVGEELPQVYEMIGPAAIPALATYLADTTHGLWARVAAVSSLRHIAQRDFQARATCVPILTEQLSKSATQDPSLNGFLANALVDLQATEALPVIRRVYADKQIDESIIGDWEDVEIEFGLREERDTPRRPLLPFLFGPPIDDDDLDDTDFLVDDEILPGTVGNRVAHQSKVKAKARAKRKQQKQSRRKNRKR
jgi:uncharacterized protein DUF1186